MTRLARRSASRIHCSRISSAVVEIVPTNGMPRPIVDPGPGDQVEEDGRGVASRGRSTSAIVSIPRRLASCPPADLPCCPRSPSATTNSPNGRGGGARFAQGLCANLAPPPRPFGLFVVADGLRGQQGKSAGGRDASRLGIETIADVLLPLLATPLPSSSTWSPGPGSTIGRGMPLVGTISTTADDILEQWIREAVRRADQVIYHCNADYDTNMASTLTLALVYKRHLYVPTVGDSRAYCYSPDKGLKRITTDHTLGTGQVDASQFKPEEIYTSPKGKKLYRYLGQARQTQIDCFQFAVEANDTVLLCTDGLWQMLRDERLEQLLSEGITEENDAQKLARSLIDEANLAGGEGNVSAIVIGIM